MTMLGGSESVDEWRVTGDPGSGYPQYKFLYRSDDDRWPGDTAGAKAREFVTRMGDSWAEGPFLHHRTVTYTPWVDVTKLLSVEGVEW